MGTDARGDDPVHIHHSAVITGNPAQAMPLLALSSKPSLTAGPRASLCTRNQASCKTHEQDTNRRRTPVNARNRYASAQLPAALSTYDGAPVGHVVIVQAAAAFLLLPMDAEHGRAQRIGEASGLENGKSLLAAHGHLGYHALTLFPGVGFLANHAKGECVESNGGAAARGLDMLGSMNVSRAVRQRAANAPRCEWA